jgi:hypothetical protein
MAVGNKKPKLGTHIDPERRLEQAVAPLVDNPLLSGVFLTDVSTDLTGAARATIKVRHGLGRKYRGFIITNGLNYEHDTSNPSKETELWLRRVDDPTVKTLDVWIF